MKNKKQNKLKPFSILFWLLISLIMIWHIWNVYWDAGSFLDVGFCNWVNNKKSNLLNNVKPWKAKEICVSITNEWKRESVVNLFFVDGLVNPHTPQFVACWREEDEQKDFWKYATFRDDWIAKEAISFTLQPWITVEKKAEIVFPDNYAGIVKWCLITIAWQNDQKKWKINIKLRKSNVIKAIVDENIAEEVQEEKDKVVKINNMRVWVSTWLWKQALWLHGASNNDKNIEILTSNEWFVINKNIENWNVFFTTKLENTWNVDLYWEVILKVTNDYWYSFYNKTIKQLLTPMTSKLINIDIPDLPIYKWTYNVEMEAKYIPEFNMDLDNVPDELESEIVKRYNDNFTIFPLSFVIEIVLLSLILFVLILIYWRKRKMSKYLYDYVVQKGDSIVSVSDMFWCNWKQIATINNIKEPYVLEEKSVIMVYDLLWAWLNIKKTRVRKTLNKKLPKGKTITKIKKLAQKKIVKKKKETVKSVSKKIVKKNKEA